MSILAYHFSNGRLANGDGRLIETGSVFEVEGSLKICRRGLHGSKRALDALQYAPGSTISRTRHTGKVVHGGDKLVSARREHLWVFDATDLLHRFARRCALDVIHLWDAPPIVVRYLRTGDEDLRAAARAAAWDAARDAAWAAARAAAWDAARDAAWAAAWAAAWDAARDAARAAARAAARDAARAAQNRRLTAMIHAEAKRLGLK